MNIINLHKKYNEYFNQEYKNIFDILSNAANNENFKIYLIGGIVRDLILNQKSLDIDITVEGNAIDFTNALEKKYNAKIISIHKDFGTAKIIINDINIDLASTRSEIYPKNGHLPLVNKIGCTLNQDIARRDFTINSLAVSLNKDNFAELIDFVDGYQDLLNKTIRVLHNKSFIEDPTRIIRALKYSSRLDFNLDNNTKKLQQEYLSNVNYDIGYKRIKQEFKKTFSLCKKDTFQRFIKEKIYKLITTENIKNPQFNIFDLNIKYNPKYSWLVYLGYLTSDIDKFQLNKEENDIIKNSNFKKLKDDFEIYKNFKNQKTETLLILINKGMHKEVEIFLEKLSKIELKITGNEFIKMGYAPSKKFSECFDYILTQKIKNPDLTLDKEKELAKTFFN